MATFDCPTCGCIIDGQPAPLENPEPLPDPVEAPDIPQQQVSVDEPGPEPDVEPELAVPGPSSGKKKEKRAKRERKLGDDEHLFQPRSKGKSKWLADCDKKWPKEAVVPSAKTTAVKSQILRWQAEAPKDKIISKLSPVIPVVDVQEH